MSQKWSGPNATLTALGPATEQQYLINHACGGNVEVGRANPSEAIEQ